VAQTCSKYRLVEKCAARPGLYPVLICPWACDLTIAMGSGVWFRWKPYDHASCVSSLYLCGLELFKPLCRVYIQCSDQYEGSHHSDDLQCFFMQANAALARQAAPSPQPILDAKSEIISLQQNLATREHELDAYRQAIRERDAAITQLSEAVQLRDRTTDQLKVGCFWPP